MKAGKFSDKRGQAMLIAVVSLGSAILGATTIAGFLMVYQIRQTTDFVDSAKAVFAADSGTEWALYAHYKDASSIQPGILGNGASETAQCDDGAGNLLNCGDASSTEVLSKGFSGDAVRAFLLQFNG